MTQSENISKGKNTQHWEPKHTNHHYNYHHDDKTSIQNATQNRDNYKINYTQPIHNTTMHTATETERMNAGKQRGEGHQVMKTELHDGKNYKGGGVWSSNRKRFPKSYDKGVSAIKGSGNNSMQRGTMEANNKPVSYTHLDVYKRQGHDQRTRSTCRGHDQKDKEDVQMNNHVKRGDKKNILKTLIKV